MKTRRIRLVRAGAGLVVLALLVGLLPSGTASATANPASISGMVLDTAGQPVAGISVSLQPTSGASTCNDTVSSDTTGQFSLADVPAGSYRLTFTDPARSYISPSYYPSTTTFSSATAVTVTAGQILTGLSQTITLGGTVTGTVSSPTGPLANAPVLLSDPSANVFEFVNTGSDGTYRLTGLPTGSFPVDFAAPYGTNLATQVVTVSSTAGLTTAGPNVDLVPGGTVTGTVQDSGGHGLGSITVFAFPTSSATPSVFLPSTVTQPSTGSFSLTGLSGTYSLEYVDNMNGSYAYQFSGGGTTLAGASTVTVTAPNTVSGLDATLSAAGKISGTVSGPTGNGLSGIQVYALAPNQGVTPSTQSQTGGAYTLGGLPTGSFGVGYNPGQYQPTYYYKNTTDYSARTSVPVTAGQTTTGIDEQIGGGSNSGSCAGSSVGLTSSLSPAVVGESVTFTAAITDPAGTGSPTGTVSFSDGGVPLGSAPIDAAGHASLTTSWLNIGSHSVTASYSGDPSYAPSSSAPITELVTIDTTSTQLTSSVNPALAGQSVTLSAQVTPGVVTRYLPSGTVTFMSGLVTIGTVPLPTNGRAQLTLTSVPVGVGPITASYGGDPYNAPSTSNTLTQTVTKIPSQLNLTSDPNPVLSGHALTLSALLWHVSQATNLAPSGSVVFNDGTTPIGTVPLVFDASTQSASASMVVSDLSPGNHQLTVSYAGDANYTSATSNSVSQSVQLEPTVTLASGLNPSYSPESVAFTLSVTGPSGAPAGPTGSVELQDGITVLGSAPIGPTGTAVITVPGLSVGTHQLTAVYGGDNLYANGTSASVSQEVVAAPTMATVSPSADPATAGSPVTITAEVASPACALCGNPTGTVTFMDGTTALGGPVDLSGGQATLVTSALTAGQHTLTAVYTPSNGFAGSTSPDYQLTVVLPAPGLQVTVTDGSGSPVAGALVSAGGSSATTDANGQAVVAGLPDGSYSVEAMVQVGSSYELGRTDATVSGGTGKVTVTVQPNQVASAVVTSTQMTLSQIQDAGINTSDPANSIVYSFDIHLSFGTTSLDLCGYTNATNLVTASSTAYSCGNPIYPGSTTYSAGGSNFSFGVGGWGGGGGGGGGNSGSPAPSLEMLQTPGVSVLKMFFHVDMTVFDLAPSGFSLGSGEATLSVPSGMSLLDGESAAQPVPDIAGGTSASVEWIVRGDTPGDYNLSASYGGILQPFGWPISVSAATAKPIHVYGPEALKMTVDADSTLYAHLPYRVKVCLQNIVDVPMYDVRVLLAAPSSSASYIFQPLQTLGYGTAEIDPGQTWCTGTYELLSPNSGTLDLSQSFVEQMSGAQAMQSTIEAQPPLFTPQTAPTLAATTTVAGVHLAWSALAGASSYAVFTTPSDATPFGGTPAETLAGSATTADVPDAGLGSWYAVSALLNGVWTMEAPMVQTSNRGPVNGPTPHSLNLSPRSGYPQTTIFTAKWSCKKEQLTNLTVANSAGGAPSQPGLPVTGNGVDYVEGFTVDGPPGHYTVTASCEGTVVGTGTLTLDAPAYVALGDSYSSGEGSPPYLDGTDVRNVNECHRSALAYPYDVANDLGYYSPGFSFHACSGDKIADFYSDNSSDANEPAQLSWLDPSTSFVTLTIGGNNADFASVLETCLAVENCQLVWQHAVDGAIAKMAGTSESDPDSLYRLYQAIRKAAPNAHIFVLGYPRWFAEKLPASCQTLSRAQMKWMENEKIKLNKVIQTAAQKAHITFVDVYSAFSGHELCTKSPDLNGVIIGSINAAAGSFHPNANGHRALAAVVESAYNQQHL